MLVIAALVVRCGTGNGSDVTATSTTEASTPALDAALVTQGREVFLQSCASCHGTNAQGAPNWQQTDAEGNLPPPPHDDSGHTWRHGDAELTGIIKNGFRDPFNETTELTMPPFGNQLSDEDIAAVITYFKSLWSDDHRHYQEEQNQKMMMATPEGTP
jgi:mono/diheme cytochrome c family protein